MIAESAAEAAVRLSPFPGLRSFEPDEDHLFFGRERQVDELLARLRRTRFLAVVGTSGSGKSSLVRSGLIPSLHSGFMVKAGSAWRIAIFRPGDDPIGNLAAALDVPDVLGGDAELADVRRSLLDATLHRSALGLAECVRQARLPAHENLLVLVDQFEELFRFKRNVRIKDSREEAVAFVTLLLESARQEEVPIYVVLTMRSDFIGNCTEFPGLAEAANDGQYLVPRMSREERRAAIVGPVAVGGGEVSPRLVLRLLNDVGDDPDQLPILQHALMRTWDHWQAHRTAGEPLDLRHYEAIGTMREALSQHAEEAYRELATERRQRIAEVLFKALTDRGSDSRGIRRPTRLGEVAALAEAGEDEVIAVVERFRLPGRSFLMPPAGVPLAGDSMLDISHESLMRTWARLIRWVDEEARSAQIYLRLSKAAAQHQEGTGGLWRDPELQLALNWREEARPNALWAERYDPAFERAMIFLDYSRRERDLYLERRERERKRQLRRARWLAVVLGSGAVLTLVFGLFALTLKVKAEELAREALAQKNVAFRQEREAHRQREKTEEERRRAEREKNNALAAHRLAVDQRSIAEAQRLRAEEEEREALAQKRRAEAARAEAESAQAQAESAKAATEAQRAIAVTEKERAEALRVQAEESEGEARRLAMLQLARALAVQTLRLNQDDQRQLSALLALEAYRIKRRFGGEDDPNVYTALRQATGRVDPAAEAVLRHHQDAVRAVALAPGGRGLATGSDDGGVRLFDLERPAAAPRVLGASGAAVRSLAAAPTGLLAAGGFDGSIRLWDLARPEAPPRALAGHAGSVNGLAVARGGLLVSGSADGQVALWDPARPDAPATTLHPGPPGRIASVAVSPDGELVAAGGAGGVRLWSLGQPAAAPRVLAAGRDVRAVAFGGNGALAAGTAGGVILLWPAVGRVEPVELAGHTAAVSSLGFDAGRGLLASASLDGSVRLWSTRRRAAEPVVLADHGAWVWAVALTPDGGRVISGGADRTVRTRWTAAEPYAASLCGRLSRNLTREEWSRHMPQGLAYEKTCPDLPATAATPPSPNAEREDHGTTAHD